MNSGGNTYAFVVLDVDGTIVGDDFKVPQRVTEAVRSAVAAGATVAIATGRMKRSALKFAAETGINGPVVCYQGAVTVAAGSSVETRHERLRPDIARRAVEYLRGAGVHINLYLDDEIFIESPSQWATDYADRMGLRPNLVPSLVDLAGDGPTVVMGVSDPTDADGVTIELSAALGMSATVTRSASRFSEVSSPNASKQQALEHISGELGIPPDRFVAFGDGPGDAPMLSWAGLGVAIDSGHAVAIEAADEVAPGPDQLGVAMYVERLLDEGRLGP